MQPFEVKLWDGEIPFYNGDADTPNKMTFYPVETWYPAPCVIIYPGGSYVHRADHEGEPVAKFFNKRGFHAAVVDYRVKPNVHPAPLADAQRAIKLCRANAEEWKIDPDKIVTLGFSAGGHLAACTAALGDVETSVCDGVSKQNHIPNGAILCYALIDFESDFGHAGCGRNLMGDDFDKYSHELSLQNSVNEKTPKVFMWHTSSDPGVNVINALTFGEKLRELGIQFELHVFHDGPHGLGLGLHKPDISKWASLAADWIARNI